MSNKEVLELMIMGKKITIACPLKDKEGLIKAAEILNEQIDSIPDKSNALILTSLDMAFKSQLPQEGSLLSTSFKTGLGLMYFSIIFMQALLDCVSILITLFREDLEGLDDEDVNPFDCLGDEDVCVCTERPFWYSKSFFFIFLLILFSFSILKLELAIFGLIKDFSICFELHF